MADLKLVDMGYSKAEMKEERAERAEYGEASPYPWGLAIRLESDELEKLGIKDLPQVGSEIHFICCAEVTGVNLSRTSQEDEACVALQITHMQVVSQESAQMEKGERETAASETAEMRSVLSMYR